MRAVLELLRPYRDQPAFDRLVQQAVAAVQRRQRVTAGVRIADPAVEPPQLSVAPPGVARHSAEVDRPPHEPPPQGRRGKSRWARGAGAAALVVGASLVLGLLLPRREADPLVAEVVEYTGSSGVAWFDHLPWYAPAVRLQLAAWLQSPQPNQREALLAWASDLQPGDDPDAQSSALKALAHQASEALEGPEQMVVQNLLGSSPESRSERQLRTEYARTGAAVERRANVDGNSPARAALARGR